MEKEQGTVIWTLEKAQMGSVHPSAHLFPLSSGRASNARRSHTKGSYLPNTVPSITRQGECKSFL